MKFTDSSKCFFKNEGFWGKNESPVLGQAVALGDDIRVKIGKMSNLG